MAIDKGEMQEWFNWHAWKACVPQKGTGGSNPPLSAKPKQSSARRRMDFYFTLIQSLVYMAMKKGKIKIKCCYHSIFALALQGSPPGITTERSEVVIPYKWPLPKPLPLQNRLTSYIWSFQECFSFSRLLTSSSVPLNGPGVSILIDTRAAANFNDSGTS